MTEHRELVTGFVEVQRLDLEFQVLRMTPRRYFMPRALVQLASFGDDTATK
jgi:hypothetical protein